MHSHGTGLLCKTGDGHLHIFAGNHYQIAELIDNHNYIRQKLVSFGRIEFSLADLVVVFFNVAGMCAFRSE